MIGRLIAVGAGLVATGVAVGVAIGSSLRPKVRKPIYEVNPGDMIQWDCHGRFVFENPRKVSRIEGGEMGTYVFVEDEKTGIPIEQVIVMRQAEESEPT